MRLSLTELNHSVHYLLLATIFCPGKKKAFGVNLSSETNSNRIYSADIHNDIIHRIRNKKETKSVDIKLMSIGYNVHKWTIPFWIQSQSLIHLVFCLARSSVWIADMTSQRYALDFLSFRISLSQSIMIRYWRGLPSVLIESFFCLMHTNWTFRMNFTRH